MSIRAAVAAILSVVCVVVASAVIPSSKASAHPNSIDYIQFNMWGRNGHGGDPSPADELLNVVDSQKQAGHTPAAISLQEVCHSGNESQINTLVDGLPEYALLYAPTVSPLPDENCQAYGIALVMIGARTGTYRPSWKYYELPGAGNEPRVLICGHAALLGEWHNACSTHLENSVDGANSQVGDVIWNATVFHSEFTPASSMYIGGDFNLQPHEFDPHIPHDHWVEADQCCNSPTWSTQSSMTEKLDYAFVEPSYVDDQWAGFRVMPLESDHALVEGYFDRP